MRREKSIITDLRRLDRGDIICSVWNKDYKKWKRVLQDMDGNDIYIHKLEVERSIQGLDQWLLCLYKPNRIDNYDKYIFYLDLGINNKVKIWEKTV